MTHEKCCRCAKFRLPAPVYAINEGLLCNECVREDNNVMYTSKIGTRHNEILYSKELNEFICLKSKKTINMYCKNCNQFICFDCAKEFHVNHQIIGIHELSEQINTAFQSSFSGKDGYFADSLKNIDTYKTMMNDSFDKFQKAMDNVANAFLAKKTTNTMHLTAIRSQFAEMHSNIRNFKDDFDKNISNNSLIGLLKSNDIQDKYFNSIDDFSVNFEPVHIEQSLPKLEIEQIKLDLTFDKRNTQPVLPIQKIKPSDRLKVQETQESQKYTIDKPLTVSDVNNSRTNEFSGSLSDIVEVFNAQSYLKDSETLKNASLSNTIFNDTLSIIDADVKKLRSFIREKNSSEVYKLIFGFTDMLGQGGEKAFNCKNELVMNNTIPLLLIILEQFEQSSVVLITLRLCQYLAQESVEVVEIFCKIESIHIILRILNFFKGTNDHPLITVNICSLIAHISSKKPDCRDTLMKCKVFENLMDYVEMYDHGPLPVLESLLASIWNSLGKLDYLEERHILVLLNLLEKYSIEGNSNIMRRLLGIFIELIGYRKTRYVILQVHGFVQFLNIFDHFSDDEHIKIQTLELIYKVLQANQRSIEQFFIDNGLLIVLNNLLNEQERYTSKQLFLNILNILIVLKVEREIQHLIQYNGDNLICIACRLYDSNYKDFKLLFGQLWYIIPEENKKVFEEFLNLKKSQKKQSQKKSRI
eukprot:TRINITY_DN3294_c3_g1_i12.p1 TRINITY_DN3294_c3_g1~~TRINITY_DN3294_c3_g1_i12.p1  ORF type:complete len:699 (-),score=153.14 TRINITY_DN3294_c3_g1_i12:1474-3570(-)